MEYQSYDVSDKKVRVLLEVHSSTNLLLSYEKEKECRVKLNEKTFWAFKFFVLESDLKRSKIDATTSTVNALLKQGGTAAAKQKQSSTASSVSPEISIDSEVPSGVETDKNADILAAIMEKKLGQEIHTIVKQG